ncbi:MAG TPA: hypothetical protein ENI51_08115 [Candidatus Atribacteria bacterium]|nr:hypothetical protein [Candidatus Atribacteria bacterium]
MVQEIKSLDSLINKMSFDLVNNNIVDEKQINKMLGVLSNDGVYAWWVYTKKELSWKFVCNADMFKRYPLVNLLLLLDGLNFLFDYPIFNDDTINKICEKQSNIEKLLSEIESLKNKQKKVDKNKKREINTQIKNNNDEIKKLNSEQNDLMDKFFHVLSENLPSLLFFRKVLEKILIYARYHAKAMEE